MIVISNQVHLRALGIAASFKLALPDSACIPGERLPYIVCLHDYCQNGERLLQDLCCDKQVDEANVAVLLPDGQNSCFLDMAHGPKWETYIMLGLLPYVERTFPLKARPRLIGPGTGGWAAARMFARFPDRFAAAAAVNAPPELPETYAAGKLAGMPDLEAAFGDPERMPAYPLHPQTLWLDGMTAGQALAILLNDDWSTPA